MSFYNFILMYVELETVKENCVYVKHFFYKTTCQFSLSVHYEILYFYELKHSQFLRTLTLKCADIVHSELS